MQHLITLGFHIPIKNPDKVICAARNRNQTLSRTLPHGFAYVKLPKAKTMDYWPTCFLIKISMLITEPPHLLLKCTHAEVYERWIPNFIFHFYSLPASSSFKLKLLLRGYVLIVLTTSLTPFPTPKIPLIHQKDQKA